MKTNEVGQPGALALGSGSGFQEYQPEIWAVKKDDIYSAIRAVQNGLEYARECLTTHDTSLGRTTFKNKSWAERMEEDIRHMERTLAALRLCPNVERRHPTNGKPGALIGLSPAICYAWPDRPGFWWVRHQWGMELVESYAHGDDEETESQYAVRCHNGGTDINGDGLLPRDLTTFKTSPEFVWLAESPPFTPPNGPCETRHKQGDESDGD